MDIEKIFNSGMIIGPAGNILNKKEFAEHLKRGESVKLYKEDEVVLISPPIPKWMKALIILGIPLMLYMVHNALCIAGY